MREPQKRGFGKIRTPRFFCAYTGRGDNAKEEAKTDWGRLNFDGEVTFLQRKTYSIIGVETHSTIIKFNIKTKCIMKKVITLFALLLLCTGMYADVVKWTAYSFCYKTHNDYYNTWSDWSQWEDCNILIVANLNIDRINIYSAETQEFDIIQYYDPYTDSDGDEVIKMECVDVAGTRCTLRFLRCQNGKAQLYCDYSNIMYVYEVYPKN